MPPYSDNVINVETPTPLMSSADFNYQVRTTEEFSGGKRPLDPNMDGVSVGPIVDKRRGNETIEYLVSLKSRRQEEKQWMARKNFPKLDWGELIEQFENIESSEPTWSNEPVFRPNNSARKEGSGFSGKVIIIIYYYHYI